MHTKQVNHSNGSTYHYISQLYQNKHGSSRQDSTQFVSSTYGEILYPSVKKLISWIDVHSYDVFLDLGSGLGKVVTQFFLETPVKEALGIEISPTLHQQAIASAQQIEKELPSYYDNDRKLLFSLNNFLTVPYERATILLLASPCYTPKMLECVGEKINHTSSIHTVLTLRPLYRLHRLKFRKAIRIQTSWDSALCYLYR